jgi:Fur family peroxide stress response transcriptional regulator
MVYAALKAEHPTLSLATVYRNLSQLADMRLARRFSLDGVDRFEGHITPHTHVICDNCGRAFDVDLLDMPGINGLYKVAEKQFPGDVARHAIVFYGLCDDCKEEMRRGL